MITLLMLDCISLALNPVFKHLFDIQETTWYGQSGFFNIVTKPAFYIHYAISIMLVLFCFISLFYRAFKAAAFYRRKYMSIALILVVVVVLNVLTFDEAVDYSVFGYAAEAICIYYCVFVFTPQQLLPKTFLQVAKEMTIGILIYDADGNLLYKNKKAERIANSLVLYVHGSQNYFNHRTNVDSKNRMLCFDIRDLGNQLKEIGMLIVQDAVWNRVSQNRERKIATRYYCDEFHLLLKEHQTALYSVEMWKRFRKWGGIPTGLTQNVSDFLKSEEIEGILGNSDFIYLLNQNAKDQAILADKLGLSEKQLAYVTNAEQGCGLILFDNIVIPFIDHYPKNTKSYAIMNTKPEESIKQEEYH